MISSKFSVTEEILYFTVKIRMSLFNVAIALYSPHVDLESWLNEW